MKQFGALSALAPLASASAEIFCSVASRSWPKRGREHKVHAVPVLRTIMGTIQILIITIIIIETMIVVVVLLMIIDNNNNNNDDNNNTHKQCAATELPDSSHGNSLYGAVAPSWKHPSCK